MYLKIKKSDVSLLYICSMAKHTRVVGMQPSVAVESLINLHVAVFWRLQMLSMVACSQDLSCLNRDLSKVIMVDWNKKSFKLQPRNGLKFNKWTGNDADKSLADLAHFLRGRCINHHLYLAKLIAFDWSKWHHLDQSSITDFMPWKSPIYMQIYGVWRYGELRLSGVCQLWCDRPLFFHVFHWQAPLDLSLEQLRREHRFWMWCPPKIPLIRRKLFVDYIWLFIQILL